MRSGIFVLFFGCVILMDSVLCKDDEMATRTASLGNLLKRILGKKRSDDVSAQESKVNVDTLLLTVQILLQMKNNNTSNGNHRLQDDVNSTSNGDHGSQTGGENTENVHTEINDETVAELSEISFTDSDDNSTDTGLDEEHNSATIVDNNDDDKADDDEVEGTGNVHTVSDESNGDETDVAINEEHDNEATNVDDADNEAVESTENVHTEHNENNEIETGSNEEQSNNEATNEDGDVVEEKEKEIEEIFEECLEDSDSDDQRLMDSFLINGQHGHKTRCFKKRPQTDFNDGLRLTEEQKAELLQRSLAVQERNFLKKNIVSYWPDGIVYYHINREFALSERRIIMDAFLQLERATCIQMKPCGTTCTRRDYIHFVRENGCWSYVGKIGGMQKMSIGAPCFHTYVVIHEIMHALGMVHEQSRKDRDKYLVINWQNIHNGKDNINFERADTINANPFDISSVLQYTLDAFSTNGLYTMTTKDVNLGFLAGNSKNLTFYDVKDITYAYKCSGKCDVKPACQNTGFVGHMCTCVCPSGLSGDVCTKLDTDNDCGGVVDVSTKSQTITSPGYPGHYPLGRECIWLVKTSEGKRIQLVIEELKLPIITKSKNCNHWLEIRYNLLGQTGPRICGEDTKDPFQSTSNSIMLLFNSKKIPDTPLKGFNLTLSSIGLTTPCDSSPCKNGGLCKVENFSFVCSCSTSWTGTTCESKDPCESSPCLNGGICINDEDTFDCICEKHWIGKRCHKKGSAGGACMSNPCENGGSCYETSSSYECTCTDGWIDVTCSSKNLCSFEESRSACFLTENLDLAEYFGWSKVWLGSYYHDFSNAVLPKSTFGKDKAIILDNRFYDYESGVLDSRNIEFTPGEYCLKFGYYQNIENSYSRAEITVKVDDVTKWTNIQATDMKWKIAKININIHERYNYLTIYASVRENSWVGLDEVQIKSGRC